MPAIGYVTREGNAYRGELRTLSIRAEITIVPNMHKSSEMQPDYRVHAAGVEIGAGWRRRSEATGKDYVSLSLAAPEFGPRRLYANLGRIADKEVEDLFAIIWNPAD